MTVIGDAYIDVKGKTDNFESSTKNQVTDLAKKAALWFAGAFVLDKGVDIFKDMIAEAEESRKVMAQTNAVIQSTGGVAGITADHIDKLSTRISNLTAVDDEAVASSANLLLTFTNVRNGVGKGNDVFDQATGLIQDMSKALGQDAKSSAIQLGKALNDPIAGATALRRVGVSLTDQQKEAIKTLVEHGDRLGAQKIILKELTSEFGGSAAAQATAGERFSVTWKNMEEEVGLKLLPILDRLMEFAARILPAALEILEGAFGALGRVVGVFVEGWTTIDTVMADGGKSMGVVGEIARQLHLGILALIGAFKDGDVTSNGFVGTMERLGVKLREAYDFVKPLFQFIQDHATPILITLGIAVAALIAPFATLTAGVIYAYFHFEAFHKTVDAIASFLVATLGPVIGGITDAIGFLVRGLSGNGGANDTLEGWQRILVQVGTIIRDVSSFIIDHWQVAILAIIGPWALITAGLVEAYNKFDLVRKAIDALAHILVDVLQGAWQSTLLIMRNAIDTVEFVGRVISDVVQVIYDLFTGKWGAAWDAFRDIPMAIIEFVSNIVGNFVDWFKTVPMLVLDALGNLLPVLYQAGKDLLLGLVNGAEAAVAGIASWLNQLPGRLLNWLGDLARLLWNVGISVMNGMVAGLEQGVAAAAAWLNQLPGRLLSWLGDLGRLLWGAAGAAVNGAVAGFEAAVSGVASWMSQLPGRMLNWLGDLGHVLVGAGGNLIRGLVNGFYAVESGIANYMATLPGRMWNWIGDAATALHGIGWNLIWGLAQGIIEFGPHLVATIKDWVVDKIPGFIKDRLGISSPSTVMMGLGANLVQGLAMGISDNGGLVDAAMAGLSFDASGAFSLSGLSGGSSVPNVGAGGGGGATVMIDLRGATVTADSMAMLRNVVTAGVLDVMEAVDRKAEAR